MVFCRVSTLVWQRSRVLLVMLTLMESIHTLSRRNNISLNNQDLSTWYGWSWQVLQISTHRCCEPRRTQLRISLRALSRPGLQFLDQVSNGSCTLQCLREESKRRNVWKQQQSTVCNHQSIAYSCIHQLHQSIINTHCVTCQEVRTPAFSTPKVLQIIQVIYTRRNGHLSAYCIKFLRTGKWLF